MFVCASCQADAGQFIRIQDSIWPEAGQTSDATPNSNREAP